MHEEIDIRRQLALALLSLEAIRPFAHDAGIVTDYVSAYDEWEAIVQAIFMSFVVLPLCDTSGIGAPEQFHRLGFEGTDGSKFWIVVDHDGNDFALFDILEASNCQMQLVLRPLEVAGKTDIWALPDMKHSFRVVSF